MDVWGIAIVAAGSAIAGGLSTFWFARPSACRSPGQADAQLAAAALYPSVVRGSGRAEQQQEVRRSGYASFIERVDSAFAAAAVDGSVPLDQRRSVSHALDIISLIGPDDVVEAAQQVALLVNTDIGRSPGDVERARSALLTAARRALGPHTLSALSGATIVGP
jgi:hypothetical protein